MDEYIWITESIAKMIHDDQISEHGGSFGIRDSGLLSSALVRPQNLSAYSVQPHGSKPAVRNMSEWS
jgi:death-on-curing protein